VNDFEQQILDALHTLELKVTRELGEIHGELKAMTEKNESDHRALRSLVEQNIRTDTDRLNKHSAEIDDNRERVAKLEAWKEQFQKQVANRIAVSQSITAIAAVVIAFLLSKLF
jgi:uncharacterized protein YlxW (UPF0749 family)